MTRLVRVAMIGCGRRGALTYLPVLTKMTGHFLLCAVCDMDETRLAAVATRYGVPAYRDIYELFEAQQPAACVLAVSAPPAAANGHALLRCAQAGIPALAETPIALTLAEADQIVATAARTRTPVEIAENYFRTPRERFKHLLLQAGLFGAVHVAYADFVGHGYHGIALLRSYAGFEQPVVEVYGDSHRFQVAEHRQRSDELPQHDELWQFGVLRFGNGARGVFSFSTLSYHSPIRPRDRAEVRFLASRGMGVGDQLTVLSGADGAERLLIEPVRETVRGIEVIAALTARGTGITWENPLRGYPLADTGQHGPLTIGLQLLALHRAVTGQGEPEYGVAAARYDRFIDLAMQQSWEQGMPVQLPAPQGGGAQSSLSSLAQ